MNKIKLRFTVFLFVILPLFCLSVRAADRSDGITTNVFVYMIGSDLESLNKQATKDLEEMLSGMKNAPEGLRLLLYGGGSTEWSNRYFTDGENSGYCVSRKGIDRLFGNEKSCMTDKNTLLSFLQRAAELYPAERNYLIFWDHGGGTLGGFGMDTNYPAYPAMTIAELSAAVQESGLHFALVGFDACLMSTVATAFALSPCADYLLASECLSSGLGLNYEKLLRKLGDDPTVSSEELGVYIAEDYLALCAEVCPEQSVGLTLTELTTLSERLPAALDALGEEQTRRVLNGEYDQVARARLNAAELGGAPENYAVDLMSFCTLLGTENALAVTECIREAVRYAEYRNMPPLGGLSLVLPFHELSNTDKYLRICEELNFCERYREFISAFNALEVCGQVAQGDGTGFLHYLLAGETGGKEILTAAEIKKKILDALDGKGNLGVSDLSTYNVGFLRSTFADEKTLNMACEYAAENSFRPSAVRWINLNGEKNVIRSFSDQQKVVGRIYQEVEFNNRGTTVSLGWIPLERRGRLWSIPVDHWYAIGNTLCLVYSLNSVASEERSATSVLIPVFRNGVSGYLTALLSEEGESMITGFMVGYERENYGLWGKVIPLSEFAPSDSIVVRTALFIRDNQLVEGELSAPMRWGDGLKPERVALPEGSRYRVCYRVCDIYDRYHILRSSA